MGRRRHIPHLVPFQYCSGWGEHPAGGAVKGGRGGCWDHGLVAHVRDTLGVALMTCRGVGLVVGSMGVNETHHGP